MYYIKLFFENPISYEESLLTGIVCLLGLVFFAWIAWICYQESGRPIVASVMVAACALMITLLWTPICCDEVKKQEQTVIALENNYCAYINGVEVDINTIDIEAFSNVKFDDEAKQVLISIE